MNEVRHAPDAPEVVQAAQIALVIIGIAKKQDWAGVLADPDSYALVRLTEEQQAILERHAGILPYLSRTKRGLPGQSRTLFACPACGRFAFTLGDAPARCGSTLGCTGVPVKAKLSQEPLPKDNENEAELDVAA